MTKSEETKLEWISEEYSPIVSPVVHVTFCESAPLALIRGLTGVLKMDLSLFSTKTLLEVAPDHEVEVRTQYRMPCSMNVDHLGQPTWECMSTRSFTTVLKYAQYQAETFKHSLKEEAEKLRSAGAKYAQQVAESAGVKRRRGFQLELFPPCLMFM
ncbi:hypothetical protein NECAME_12897 [Necator americanus]|uniref:Uncharacterized protein n=1 Tax=Necator americanus TaxID=51031 RepID=W2SY53_NECAM|nr:hypothetical protein NECAME_12897 [Necator americanus]ETN74570.1 hypothetical protein NECAME_12897 [Necator americanus]